MRSRRQNDFIVGAAAAVLAMKFMENPELVNSLTEFVEVVNGHKGTEHPGSDTDKKPDSTHD